MESAPITFAEKLAPEDQARADFYALLSRLFAQPPDAALLATLGSSGPLEVAEGTGASESAAALAGSWRALVDASAGADAQAVAAEYQTLFVGVGQSEVSLHGSAYAKGASGTPLLVQVRASLAQLHLARQPGVTMFEDHVAAVLETMRLLITGDNAAGPTSGQGRAFAFDVQREFFRLNIEPWAEKCCNAICNKAVAMYYARVAQFACGFLVIERDSFAIES
ncbi:MAG: molecular chaperone TorD family protein [Betaproteobacteria bacterium]